MTFSTGGNSETTYYIGGNLEKVVTSGGTDFRHTISGSTGAVAIVSRTSAGANVVRYILTDQQGSVDSIADATGATIANASFSAYGTRRGAATWSGAPANASVLDGVTRQGYTFQTALGLSGLNHMKGRVQDAFAGRFLSPDPYVSQPVDTQSYNRYAYVQNNPLTYTDPSGFTPGTTTPSSSGTLGSCYGAGSACASGASTIFAAVWVADIIVSAKRQGPTCDATCQNAAFNRSNIADLQQRMTPANVFPPSTMPIPQPKPNVLESRGRGERGQSGKSPKPTKGVKPRFENGKLVGWWAPGNQDGKKVKKPLDWGIQEGLNPEDFKQEPKKDKEGSKGTDDQGGQSDSGGSQSSSRVAPSYVGVGAFALVGGSLVVLCVIAEPCGVIAGGAAAIGGGAALATQ
jgi:RHS repeat-associated protein